MLTIPTTHDASASRAMRLFESVFGSGLKREKPRTHAMNTLNDSQRNRILRRRRFNSPRRRFSSSGSGVIDNATLVSRARHSVWPLVSEPVRHTSLGSARDADSANGEQERRNKQLHDHRF